MAVWPSGFDGEAELDEMDELLRTAARAPASAAIVQHRAAARTRAPTSARASSRSCRRSAPPGRRRGGGLRRRADAGRSSACSRTRLEMRVVDRTAVILDIFAAHAHTAEGKLQVELAQLEYSLPRMRGMWKHLERLGGGRRHARPGRVAAGDRPPAGAHAHPAAARSAAARAVAAPPHGAQAPRGLRDAVRLARRLHQRRQVDAAERAHRRRGVVGRPPVRDARPDHARLRVRRPRVHAHRHRRLHPQAAARPRRGVRVDARGDDRGRPACSTSPTPRRRRRSALAQQARRRGGAGRDRRGRDRRGCWC